VVAGEVLIRRHVGAGGRSVGHCGIAHPVEEPRPRSLSLPREEPRVSSSPRWQVRRVVPQRARPDIVPFAPSVSTGLSTTGVEVLKGPQRPPMRALERQQRAWRESVLARSTATGGARHGW
jgi:hypothetical protein